MVLSEEAEDTLFKKHQELGIKLNLDPTTITQAWETFQNIRTKYTLEVCTFLVFWPIVFNAVLFFQRVIPCTG